MLCYYLVTLTRQVKELLKEPLIICILAQRRSKGNLSSGTGIEIDLSFKKVWCITCN